MQKRKFRINIEAFIQNPLDKVIFDIPIPRQTIEFEEEHSYTTILKLKEPDYPKIKETLLKMAYANYIAFNTEPDIQAHISIWVESDEPNNKEYFEHVTNYIVRINPRVRLNDDKTVDVSNSTLWYNGRFN